MIETAPSPHRTHQIHASRTSTSQQPAMTPFLSPQPPSHHASQPQRLPSPNYFGYQGDNNSDSFTESLLHVKNNWSPPSSSVRSTLAVSPSVVPNDRNPDFDAFRRQSDQQKTFGGMGSLNNFKMNIPKPKSQGERSSSGHHAHVHDVRPSIEARDISTPSSHRIHLDPSASELSRSPKRALSPLSAVDSHRRGSPASFVGSDQSTHYPRSSPTESLPRFQLPHESSASIGALKPRAETEPESTGSAPQALTTPERVVNLISSRPDDLLIVDMRVHTQYAKTHITSAVNLCVPGLLLKRSSSNMQTLADMIQGEQQRRRFESWKSIPYILVYDDGSSQLKESSSCQNLIKKFEQNKYSGTCYMIKGGFTEFSKRYPRFIEQGCDDENSPDSDGPEYAPVAGGCPMPATDQPMNPFFGNIRQNMDLIGGVGQIALQHPTRETPSTEKEYPEWLRQASEDIDQGKQVSRKFEQIEEREKKRMEDALSGKVSFGTPGPKTKSSVQIAGLEKGNKNRYNNIWPFEHSRVKLQGIPGHGCDYFNASYIKASRSNKSYISTQAPIPATFDDFWNVVWQQDVRVIVMLTAEKEGAQVKAHNYWNQKQYGPLVLEPLSEKRASLELSRINKHIKRPAAMQRHSTKSAYPHIPLAQIDSRESSKGISNSEQPHVIVRKFTLRNIKRPYEPLREITQLQYSHWPDFGAPASPAHLLGLVEQCDAVGRAANNVARSADPEPLDNRPTLVHCSAGCGRTGTFCTVDSVIDMLKRQRISRDQQQQHDASVALDASISAAHDAARPKKSARQEPQPSKANLGSGDFFASKPAVPSPAPAATTTSHNTTTTTAPTTEMKLPVTVDGAWITRDDLDLVESTVEDFRHQRLSMVQSLRQFVLCYESIMEWLVERQEFEKERKEEVQQQQQQRRR